MTNASVTFSAKDNGVSSFMNKMKSSSQEMTSQLLRDTEKQKQSARELLKLAEDKIKASERANKLESQIAASNVQTWARERKDRASFQLENLRRGYKEQFNAGAIDRETYKRRMSRLAGLSTRFSDERIDERAGERINIIREQSRQSSLTARLMLQNIETIRQTSREQVGAVRSGNASVRDAIENDNLDETQTRVAQRAVMEEIADEKKSSRLGHTGRSLLSLANAMAIDRVGGMLAAMPGARNELDFAKPLMSLAGLTTGGLLGIGADAIAGTKILGTGIGQTNFASLGIQLGSKAGEFVGAAIERTFRSRDELAIQQYKTQALTGYGAGGGTDKGVDLTQFGLDYKEAESLRLNMSSAKGRYVGNKELMHLQALESGYGVSSSATSTMFELVRSNAWSDRYVPSIIAGIKQGLFGSGDRTYLNEFITRNYASLQKAMLSSQNTVSSGSVLSIAKGLTGLGGQWEMKHQNAPGLWSQLQSSLSNPNSDAAKALGFTVMRRANPNMSLLDIQMEMQKGLNGGGGTYLQTMIEYVKSQGGDKSYQVNNLASLFGLENNLAAAQSLFEGKLPARFTSGNVAAGLGEAMSLGASQTSIYSKSTAEIENAFISSAVDGIATMKNKMTGLFGDMMDELSIVVKKMITDAFGPSDTPKPKPTPNNPVKRILQKKEEGSDPRPRHGGLD